MSDFPPEKCVSSPQKVGAFFKKMYQKTMTSAAKTLKKFKNIESPRMVSKRLYGHYLRSYEQIKKNRILTTKSHVSHGNGSKIS